MYTGAKLRRQMNPRYKANVFSILMFGWTLETFKLGYTRDIKESDLYAPLPEHKSSTLGNALQRAWDKEVEYCNISSKTPSLIKVLIKVFGSQLMFYGLILAAMEFIIRLQQPLFLGLLLRYYKPTQDVSSNSTEPRYMARFFSYYEVEGNTSWGEAVFFGFCVVMCSAANVMVQHPFMMTAMHIGMKMRVGVCSLIYRKALKVSSQTMSESNVGAGLVVNLMANDVNRFDNGPLFIHYLWIGPVETLLTTLYLYRELGFAAFCGAFVIVLVIPFQLYLGTQTARYRKCTALKSDERVRLMKEIVMGIEVIKMYTWEQPFRKIIGTVRRLEIHCIKMASFNRGVVMSFIMFTSRFSIFVTTLVFVMRRNAITVETVFFLTCFYNILKQTMTLYFPQTVGHIAEMLVAIKRIRDYLLSEECQLPRRVEHVRIEPSPKKRVTINTQPETGPIAPVVKPETSKNTHSVSDEIVIHFDDASTRWLKGDNNNVKNIDLKIPGGSLNIVIGAVGSGKSTLLHMILGELPCTTGSLVTSGSVSYASQEPWLFVGSVRQNILFGQPFNRSRYMEVCRVCALERDISLFPHGDKTVVGERGVSLSGGQRARINLARTVYKEADIYLLDDPLSAVDTKVSKHIFEKCIQQHLGEKTVILVTHQLQFMKFVDNIVVMQKGKVLAQGDYQKLRNLDLEIIKLMEDKKREVSEHSEPISAMQASVASIYRRPFSSMIFDTSLTDPRPQSEVQTMGRVDNRLYKDYFLAGNICPLVCLVVVLFILSQMSASAGDYWITLWCHSEEEMSGKIDTVSDASGHSRKYYTMIFGLITLTTIAVALIRSFTFFTLCMRSSIRLHDHMFECISRSPMSFFHVNPSGRILNRFSKDMGAVDELLPQAMIDCCQIILTLFGVIVVILLADITLLIPVVTSLIIFYIFRVIYIRTTAAVKRLEGITRSPVFSHLNASVLGLATIRSFGAEELLVDEFDRHQDLHNAAWYLFISCSRAFGYFLDMICLLFIVCVTFGCLMKVGVEGSSIGLIITQSISLTGVFQWGMRQSAEMENQMTSVERVIEYTKLPQEPSLKNALSETLPKDWPFQGQIEFSNLTLRYSPDGNAVLHKVDLQIQPKEKVGIVGRTGAGKSSIIQALFRLGYVEGTIIIDGVDITTIGLHDLRSKISIIPQEPVLFSGTMRKNLDPFDEYSDDVLLNALDYVELIDEDSSEGALYKEVSEGGSNFSVGERQLVCLARAIVRHNRVLVLDEATANVDAQTDALIQTAIRRHFNDCTVLTIAHRLNTVIDSDKILVLDAGRLLEYDSPHMLLRNPKSAFRKMVAETGPAMAAMLHKMAYEAYKTTHEQ